MGQEEDLVAPSDAPVVDGARTEQQAVVPLSWDAASSVDVHPANQFLFQYDGHDCYLTIGHAVPPALLGATPEERARELERFGRSEVRVVARFALSVDRLRELRDLLSEGLAQAEGGQQP